MLYMGNFYRKGRKEAPKCPEMFGKFKFYQISIYFKL